MNGLPALDVLWRPRTLISILFAGEALALLVALAPGNTSDRWVYFGLASLMIQWTNVLTLAVLAALRSTLARLPPTGLVLVTVTLLMSLGWLVAGSAWFVFQEMLLTAGESARGFMARSTIIHLVAGLLAAAALQNHMRVTRLALRAKQAELESLQARTHPHFLFNTINTAIALLPTRPTDAEQVLLDLADLFRAALATPALVDLEVELGLVRRYLAIEQLRLGQRLNVRWTLPDPLPHLQLPSLSIQPLVENAVRHGVERRLQGGGIELRVHTTAEGWEVSVSNDLPELPAPPSGGHGVGLRSVLSRIESMTGGTGSLSAGVSGATYRASIHLPADSDQTTTS